MFDHSDIESIEDKNMSIRLLPPTCSYFWAPRANFHAPDHFPRAFIMRDPIRESV